MVEILAVTVVVVVVLNWVSEGWQRRSQQERLTKLERKIDLIMDQVGVVVPEPDGMTEVDQLVRAGRKVEAVKRYRELTGDGLLEAKTAVDERETGLS